MKPISLACVLPDVFPKVALYTKNDHKYILYKDDTRDFTTADRDRLLKSNNLTMYVNDGDYSEVSKFAEENLGQILQRKDIDEEAKTEALRQTTSAYLGEIFADPEQAQDAQRCKKISGHLAQHITETANIARLIQTIGGASAFAIKHSMQVAATSMLAWSKLFPENQEDITDIGVAGLLHDLGMSLILPNVMEDQDYWSTPSVGDIRRHPFEGYIFLRKNGQYSDLVLDAVRHHHERYFGGGYPGGLKGDEIKMTTQMIGLVDMYCTLITDRPHRKASTPEEAFKIIGDETHRCFSTILFLAFRAMFSSQPNT